MMKIIYCTGFDNLLRAFVKVTDNFAMYQHPYRLPFFVNGSKIMPVVLTTETLRTAGERPQEVCV